MKPNFLKSSSIALEEKKTENQVEKQTEQKQKEKVNIFAPKPQIKQENDSVEIKSIKPERPTINLFSAKTFEDAKQQSEKLNILSSKKMIPIVEEPQQNIAEPEIEQETEQFVEFSQKPKTHKKEWKFRLKLLTAIYCVTIALLTGWVGTNAVRIANINNSISSTQTEISVNQAKFINEIQKLDDLKNQEPDYENTQLIPIGEIIEVTPFPLEDMTEYEKESNWFDNIVNWFGNLFGG